MTDELRQKANALYRQIGDIRAQIQIVESMHHCDNDIIDIVLRNLSKQEEEAEDEYRRL